jgi:hypothetical protein
MEMPAKSGSMSDFRCMRIYAAHELRDGHASFAQQLVRVFCLGQWKSPRDERLDFVLFEELQEREQVLAKPCRFQPFEPLDAVGNHTFPSGQKPAAGNVQPEDADLTKAMTTTGMAGSESPAT